MQTESFDVAYRAARRRYELGRLLTAARHAAIATALVATAAALVVGKDALLWLPLTFVAIVFTEWRGSFLMKSARRGLIVGSAAMLLPLTVLRPCCGMDAKALGASCCTMPSACWATGAFVGLAMALLLPEAPRGSRARVVAGMVIGVTSVAVTRCSVLFIGEGLGLLGGMAIAVVAASLARSCLARLRAVTS